MRSSRLLILAAALHSVAVGGVAAQTVIATKAPPGSTVEFVLNTTPVATQTADAVGTATLTAPQSAAAERDLDAHIYVDVCDAVRRVLVVERSVPLPAEAAGCRRMQIAGLFLVRRVSTLVVNVDGGTPSVLLRQGPFTPPAEGTVPRGDRVPTGLVISGGGAFTSFRDPVVLACGNVTDCSGDASVLGYTVGAAYWIGRFVAAEVTYLKPSEVRTEGRQQNFRFNSFLEAHVMTIAGKVGGPAGPVRLYGQIGANYHRATSGTTQTHDPVTVTTAAGVTTTTPGGTQSYRLKTAGWGWVFGGGAEAWLTRSVGLYSEAGRVGLSGGGVDDADGGISDRVLFVVFGARVRIGR